MKGYGTGLLLTSRLGLSRVLLFLEPEHHQSRHASQTRCSASFVLTEVLTSPGFCEAQSFPELLNTFFSGKWPIYSQY